MSDEALRDLLHDRVADETTVDLSVRAWRAGRAVRRTRTAAVVGAGALVVATVIGVTQVYADPSGPMAPTTSGTPTPPSPPTLSPSPTTPTGSASPAETTIATPGPSYQGAQTWWLRDAGSDSSLPQLDGSSLPRRIDLASGGPSAIGAGPVVALLGVVPDGPLSRVVAVTADGVSRSVDVTRLDPVSDEPGNLIAPLVGESLAPDGRRAFFVQERSLEVLDLDTGEWTTVATPAFLAEGARWTTSTEIWVPDRLGSTGRGTSYDLRTERQTLAFVKSTGPEWDGGTGFGPVVATSDDQAQAVFLTEMATGPGPDVTSYGGLAAVAVARDEATAMLVIAVRGWWKGCCPTVGFVDDTVLFEARSGQPRVLAWDVGIERVRQVATIKGLVAGQESYVASWRVPLS